MRISESLLSSFKSLFHNKLRTFLTMLGVIIGVFSVIVLTSIGEGVKKQVTSQVESLGANLLYVLPGKIEIGIPKKTESKLGVSAGRSDQGVNPLTYDDVLALKGKDHIAAVTGIYHGIDKLDVLKIFVSTTGVDEDFAEIRELDLEYGRFISKKERESKARVAVIGNQANKELFDGKNSIGKTFKMDGRDYKVVGILRYKKPENLGPQGEDFNVKIYLPITELVARAKDKHIGQILVKAQSAKTVKAAEKSIKDTLKKRHKQENYSVLKQQDMLNVINNILGILTAGLGGIAAISLLVGGVGIMNIMLVSVAERTREIGVRKAIGAKQRDILLQFLIESVVLSVTGGLIGLGLGILGSRFLPSLVPTIETAISPTAELISLLFALFVGIFFGVYPAIKAARLNPIEALRSE